MVSTGDSSPVEASLFEKVNIHLESELNCYILSPEQGVQKIRKVLYQYGLDLPAIYDLDATGNEYIIELDYLGQEFGMSEQQGIPDAFVYIIYYLTDDGNYDFHAEMIRESDIDDILSDDEGEEEIE